MRIIAGFFAAVIVCLVLIVAFTIDSLRGSATDEPAAVQAKMMGRVKLWLIPQEDAEAPPGKAEQNILEGGKHYNEHCAACHDLSGDADSAFAQSFYPPIANLLSKRVQNYSDNQLKWIIDNGIRYTGMPGWTRIIADESQWKIVYYLRALNSPEQKQHYRRLLEESGNWKAELETSEEEENHAH